VNTDPAARKPLPATTPHTQRLDLSLIEAVAPDADPQWDDLIAATAIGLHHQGQPVPVTVWRVAAGNDTGVAGWASGMHPRVAGLLVGLTTRPGDTVVDFDAEPALEGVAGAYGLHYVAVTGPDQLAKRHDLRATVALICLRYPRPVIGDPVALINLFNVCANIQAPHGHTVVALVPPVDGPPYAVHAARVTSAAHQAGLGYVEHIIAVAGSLTGDTDVTDATLALVPPAVPKETGHHVDLLVFVLRAARA
jgi:hypothetical protein